MMARDFAAACAWFADNANDHPRLRPYQIEANQAIERAISEYVWLMLVAMATGTGKTFMVINEIYRLMKSGLARRILFLVDRRALAELKDRLIQAPDGFTVESLQKAHQVCYKKSLVDIISMVKHAAREQELLLTAEERVDRAFVQITADRQFTDAQQQWLERIRAHLIENLSTDPEDFDDLPVFARYGGWAKADRDFDGELMEVLTTVNGAVAA
jgi:hypothetical protein